MTTSQLKRLQVQYFDALQACIEEHLRRAERAGQFCDMMRYQLGFVDEQLRPSTHAGGKGFRPMLCLMACEGVGGRWNDALPMAVSIELLHNFSLIHDDIEDGDPARRHRPTVWKLWGEPQAINVGDAMFILSWGGVLESGVHALDLARAFRDACLDLTEGQYLDMSFEGRRDVTADEYLRMISLKTGAVIAYSLWSGATIGGAGEGTRESLHRFGRELGRAFQIHDDVMGIWGARSATGKEPVKDLENRKKTLPVLLALERAGPSGRAELQAFLYQERDDLPAVLSVLEETEARAATIERLRHHLDAALAALDRAEISTSIRQQFRELAGELAGQ